MSEQQERYVSAWIILRNGRVIDGQIRLPAEDLEHLHLVIDKKYGLDSTELLPVVDILVEPRWSEWLGHN